MIRIISIKCWVSKALNAKYLGAHLLKIYTNSLHSITNDEKHSKIRMIRMVNLTMRHKVIVESILFKYKIYITFSKHIPHFVSFLNASLILYKDLITLWFF